MTASLFEGKKKVPPGWDSHRVVDLLRSLGIRPAEVTRLKASDFGGGRFMLPGSGAMIYEALKFGDRQKWTPIGTWTSPFRIEDLRYLPETP